MLSKPGLAQRPTTGFSLKIMLCIALICNTGFSSAGVMDWLNLKDQKNWSSWEGYKNAFISEDGRVIDHSTDDLRTVSEGQAYAMFLSLIANDEATFKKLLNWTERNLSKGNLSSNLPAWLWGKSNNKWQVIDSNSASDADMWMVYSLLEAGKKWCNANYTELGENLANLVLAQQVLHISGLGLSLLPGRYGFVQPDGKIKLNPSYVPSFLLARLANLLKHQPGWAKLYLSSQALLLESNVGGLYPDWLEYENGETIQSDPTGDYDAIRIYLWLGLTADSDPVYKSIIHQINPFLDHIEATGYVPERWHLRTGEFDQTKGPAGFQYALAPLLQRNNRAPVPLPKLPKQSDTEKWKHYGYYNGLLSLFSQAFIENRFQIRKNGQLVTNNQNGDRCEN